MKKLSLVIASVGFIVTLFGGCCNVENEANWWYQLVIYFVGIAILIISAVAIYMSADDEYKEVLKKADEEQQEENEDFIPLVSPITDFEMVYLQTLKYKEDK